MLNHHGLDQQLAVPNQAIGEYIEADGVVWYLEVESEHALCETTRGRHMRWPNLLGGAKKLYSLSTECGDASQNHHTLENRGCTAKQVAPGTQKAVMTAVAVLRNKCDMWVARQLVEFAR